MMPSTQGDRVPVRRLLASAEYLASHRIALEVVGLSGPLLGQAQAPADEAGQGLDAEHVGKVPLGDLVKTRS